MQIDSPVLRQLREAGIKLAVPLISNGELIGLLNLGGRQFAGALSVRIRGRTPAADGVDVAPDRISIILISEAAPAEAKDRYYAGSGFGRVETYGLPPAISDNRTSMVRQSTRAMSITPADSTTTATPSPLRQLATMGNTLTTAIRGHRC